MSKKHFVPPIIEQWISNINSPNNNTFGKETYVGYLEYTRDAINEALVKYNSKKSINIKIQNKK
jgi:hypothetical protein